MGRILTFCFIILISSLAGCDTTDSDSGQPEEPEKIGEFVDDWTYQVYAKYPYSNFDVGEFRLWVPENTSDIRATLILVNFNNSDGLGLVNAPAWQTFAKKEKLGLIGVHLKSEGGGINHYSYASLGSGAALLKAFDKIAAKHNLQEITDLPFLIRGYSSGGIFSYNFTAYLSDRVIAFANIRGGVANFYNNEITHRNVPGIMLIGKDDSDVINSRIIATVDSSRKKGANWSYAIDPNVGHFGRLDEADELIRTFFSKALPKRLTDGSNNLATIPEQQGWLGNNETKETYSFESYPQAKDKASWLIDEEFGMEWKQYQKD